MHVVRRICRLAIYWVCAAACLLAQASPGFWQLPGDFVDEFGNHGALGRWQTDLTLISMEYSECRFVCSNNWRRLVSLQEEADREHRAINVLIISLDPEHDTPAAWREYRKIRGLARTNWNFITADRAATNRVIKFLGVKWWYFNDSIMHDFRIIRLNARGEIAAVMDNYEITSEDFLTAR